MEEGTWLMASADSATLLQQLLRQGAALPPPPLARGGGAEGASAGAGAGASGSVGGGVGGGVAADGVATWAELMRSLGKEAAVAASQGCLADRMLGQWVSYRLQAPPALWPLPRPACLLQPKAPPPRRRPPRPPSPLHRGCRRRWCRRATRSRRRA